MYTREELAVLLHSTVQTIGMLQELGLIRTIKIDRSFLVSQEELRHFRKTFIGKDISNQIKAQEALKEVRLQGTFDT